MENGKKKFCKCKKMSKMKRLRRTKYGWTGWHQKPIKVPT